MATLQEIHTDYRAAMAADAAWSTELRKAFGSNASRRRYDRDQAEHPQACRDACAAFLAANARYLSHYGAANGERYMTVGSAPQGAA